MSLRAPWVGWTIISLLLLAAPVEAAPVSGKLSVGSGVEVDGQVTWATGARLVELEAEDGIPPFSLDVSAATGTVYVERKTTEGVVASLMGDSVRQAETEPELLHDVSIERILLHQGAHMTVDLAGSDTATMSTTHAVLDAASQVYASVDPRDNVRSSEPVNDYSIAGSDWIVADMAGVTMDTQGRIVLAFWNTELTLDSADGPREYRTGQWTEESRDTPVPTSREVTQLVWMVLDAATVHLTWADQAMVAGPAPRIDVTGMTTLPAAEGSVRVDDLLGIEPRTETVAVTGTYALGPLVDQGAGVASAKPSQLVTHYDRFGTGVRGDADRIEVSGKAVQIPETTLSPVVAAGAAGVGLLALAGAAYRWGPLALAALYSRLEEGEMLKNATRANIYEIVKRNPGISARQIHRLSTASWGTVVHHLNKLHDAGYVAARNHGRAKCFYENHGKWDAYQEQLAVLTGDKTAAVAEAIAAVPGRDQNQIITRTGFSQSTVSYHLLKLEKAGLVAKERTGTAMAYFPTAALRDLRARLPAEHVRPPAGAVGGAA